MSDRLAVIVMGVSGSGKSSLGALLAKRLNAPFVEGDEFHDARTIAKMHAGRALDDRDRGPWLDRVAQATVMSLASEGVVVVACSALRRRYRDRLRAAIASPVVFVLLDAPRNDLFVRLERRLGHFMPASLIDSQLATLERPDAEEDALSLDATVALYPLCERVLTWLMDRERRGGQAHSTDPAGGVFHP